MSTPTFIEEPKNGKKAEEEDVTFVCHAGGKPQPKVEWSINVIPIDSVSPDSRRTYNDETLTYTNLTKTDSQ